MKKTIITLLLCGVMILGITGCRTNTYYKDISSLPNIESRDSTSLFMFNDKLYIKSNGVIDYAGCDEYIGKIDTLIDKNKIPKYNGETNNEKMLNAYICSANEKNAVIEYNNEFVLFENLK